MCWSARTDAQAGMCLCCVDVKRKSGKLANEKKQKMLLLWYFWQNKDSIFGLNNIFLGAWYPLPGSLHGFQLLLHHHITEIVHCIDVGGTVNQSRVRWMVKCHWKNINNAIKWLVSWNQQRTRPRGYKTWVQSQTHNKVQWLAAYGHVSPSSQSLHFILSLRMNSSFITSRPGCFKWTGWSVHCLKTDLKFCCCRWHFWNEHPHIKEKFLYHFNSKIADIMGTDTVKPVLCGHLKRTPKIDFQ